MVLAVIGSHTPVAGTPVAKLKTYCPTRALIVHVPELLVNIVSLVLVPVIADDCWGVLYAHAEEPIPSEFSINLRLSLVIGWISGYPVTPLKVPVSETFWIVGAVPNTAAPLPVSSDKAPAKFAEEKEPKTAALPVEVTCPVRFAFVVTVAALPVMFV